jgi:hypothetical protein
MILEILEVIERVRLVNETEELAQPDSLKLR